MPENLSQGPHIFYRTGHIFGFKSGSMAIVYTMAMTSCDDACTSVGDKVVSNINVFQSRWASVVNTTTHYLSITIDHSSQLVLNMLTLMDFMSGRPPRVHRTEPLHHRRSLGGPATNENYRGTGP